MAYTDIDKPSDYFNTSAVWSGDDSEHTISGIGHQPNFTWIKGVNIGTQHYLFDSVRGATKVIIANGTNAEFTVAQTLKSWNSDGFVLGTSDDVNGSGRTYVSWNWKESATAGFDIVAYTGNGSSGLTVSHSLSAIPSVMIIKNRSGDYSWAVYHHKNTSAPETETLFLDTTDATADRVNEFNDTAPTSSLFTVGNGNSVNNSSENFIAYLFAEKQGFSKFGSYTGNGNADGTFVYTGFKPAWVMIKRTDSAQNWMLFDNKRDPDNVVREFLEANTSDAENSNPFLDFLSNGFKLKDGNADVNASGGTYIYMAFAENPFVTSSGVPACAR